MIPANFGKEQKKEIKRPLIPIMPLDLQNMRQWRLSVDGSLTFKPAGF
jgi:hypothetical protein